MKKRKIIKDPKRRGEWVESVFMARAGEMGLAVSKPWGDSRSYDFVVGRPGRFVSVQVKSTVCRSGGGYECCLRGRGNKAYARGSFDFLAAYVVLTDAWYIIPAEKVLGRETVCLYSASRFAKYEEYREAWHLLREAAELGGQAEGGDKSAEEESGVSGLAGESTSLESRESGSAADAPATGRFPRNAVERMEAAANFARRYLEGDYPRPQKERETSSAGSVLRGARLRPR